MKYIYYIETFVFTSVLWFLLSGKFELKFIIFGLFSCAIISFICLKGLTFKGVKTEREYYAFHVNYLRLALYFLWMLKEIINAALYVSKLITYKYDYLDPDIVWFKADYDNPLARAVLANSITITPGTVTVDIYDNGIFSVHAVSEELREGVLDGGMQRRVAAVFGEEIDFKIIEAGEIDKSEKLFSRIISASKIRRIGR